MNQIATIRHYFGSRSRADCAMDAREYKRGGNPKNPGQFSSGGGGSSPATKPKKEAKASTAKFPESMTAKPSRRRNGAASPFVEPEAKAAPKTESSPAPKAEAKPAKKLPGGSYKSPSEKLKRVQHAERGYTEKELNKAKTTKGTLKEHPKAEPAPAATAKPKNTAKPKTEKKPKAASTKSALSERLPPSAAKASEVLASPESFHAELKRLNAYAALNTATFNEKLGQKLKVNAKKGESLAKAIGRFQETHSDAEILKAAGAVANENTRTH